MYKPPFILKKQTKRKSLETNAIKTFPIQEIQRKQYYEKSILTISIKP